MIIRTLDEVIGTERDVAGEGWRSRRLLLKRDAMGFSLHDTVVKGANDHADPPSVNLSGWSRRSCQEGPRTPHMLLAFT